MIVELSKLRIIGLKSETDKVMDALSDTALFHCIPSEELDGTSVYGREPELDMYIAKQTRLSFAVEFVRTSALDAKVFIKKQKLAKDAIKIEKTAGGRQLIGQELFENCSADEDEIFALCDKIDALSFERVEIKSEISKLLSKRKSLIPYFMCGLKFSEAKKYKNVTVGIGQFVSAKFNPEALLKDYSVVLDWGKAKSGGYVSYIAHNDDAADVKKILSDVGVTFALFSDDVIASQMIYKIDQDVLELNEKLAENYRKTLAFNKNILDIKTLYDVYGLRAEKLVAKATAAATSQTCVLEGWVPKEKGEEIENALRAKTENVALYFEDPAEDELPPTLLKNNPVVSPFEDVTNMYSPPSYREKDPNFIMAIFYFIVFGMMTADAGYGLIMALASIFVVFISKMERGTKRFMAMIGICSISAIVWGVLFGGFFAIEGIPALWFNPMEEPLLMLIVCLALGVIHLSTGYCIHAYYLIKKGKVWSAIFDDGFIILLFLGLALWLLGSMALKIPMLGNIGLYMLLAAVLGIFLTSGRAAKNPLVKFLMGFKGLYGLINLFSDVLSYARIFGLALASGAIGLAFNAIIGIIATSPVGVILAVILSIVLHLFNLLIGALSTYVHNARLQFLEFYGKFYTGEGKLFTPMGVKTKYIRFV